MMGEIKSTLDLVMERTRHMSLSEAEKARQQEAEFQKRLRGLLQQYADERLSVETLNNHIAQLQGQLQTENRRTIISSVLQRIDPEQDNQCWLNLLRFIAPAMHSALDQLLQADARQRSALLAKAKSQLTARFERDLGLGGSAVAPNPHKDEAFRRKLADLRQETRTAIDRLRA